MKTLMLDNTRKSTCVQIRKIHHQKISILIFFAFSKYFNFSQLTTVPSSNVKLQKYSVITTDFNSGDQNQNPKDKEEKFQFVESLKDKGKLNYHNNNRNDAESIDDNCSDCRKDSNTNMSNNNIKVSSFRY